MYSASCLLKTKNDIKSSGAISFQRFASTTSGSDGSTLNFLELMEINASAAPGSSGTIFSDTGPVMFTADFLCALKDFDGNRDQ
jgi:hypothetical protein